MNIVLFDGICNLCNRTVSFLIKNDTNNLLHYTAQQNQAGIDIMHQYGIEAANKSVIFIKEDKVFYKSDAIIEISKLLTGWPRILKYSYLFPKLLRDGIYDIIAVNRYRLFGKRTTCSIPTKEHQHKFL
jgi:predicted DCC family thiol-disulfide oxidoreductase YuxK